MQVFHNAGHSTHAPRAFVTRGRLSQCPETPERAAIMLAAVRAAGHSIVVPDAFGLAPVERVHDPRLVQFLDTAWAQWQDLPGHGDEVLPNVHPGRNMDARPAHIVGLAGRYQADAACPIGAGTWSAVRGAVDTALGAAQAVMQALDSGERAPQAYALARPPGHHAFADQAGGFCYLNNSAIAAQFCRDAGARRVAILDVDVHHGNGTQGIFYRRADVLTVSIHGDPSQFYPFYAGYRDERGADAGAGFNLNHPLPFGSGDDRYLQELEAAVVEVQTFAPDVLVVALGLDASKDDGHQAFLQVTTEGFERIGTAIGRMRLPSVLVQEGGYVCKSLGDNLAAVLRGVEAGR